MFLLYFLRKTYETRIVKLTLPPMVFMGLRCDVVRFFFVFPKENIQTQIVKLTLSPKVFMDPCCAAGGSCTLRLIAR